MNLIKHLWIGIFTIFGLFLNAQTNPDLEFTQNSRGTGNGPTLNSSAFTFYRDLENPVNSGAYKIYDPPLTATFVISNPQVTSGTGISTVTNSPVNFGYLGNSATAIITRMSSVGLPLDSYYTSSGATTAGTGMAAASTYSVGQSNYMVSVNQSVGYLGGTNPAATNYQADMTITFNRPVNNPIIHIGGFGGVSGGTGYSALYELDSFAASSGSLTFSKLSGTPSLSVVGTTIGNSSTTINTSGNNSASGSVLITGNGITSIKFKVYVRGDGRGAGATSWVGGTATIAADGYTLGVTLLESDLSISNSANTLTPDFCNPMTFTLLASNLGGSNSANTIVNALLPSGYTYVSSNASAGTYDSATGIWNLGNFVDTATQTLTITAKANTTGNYTFVSTISGDNGDPNSSNNTSSVTTTPSLGADTDGDGISNSCDLDDDNDGILDTVENNCTSPINQTVFSIGFESGVFTGNLGNGVTMQGADMALYTAPNGTGGQIGSPSSNGVVRDCVDGEEQCEGAIVTYPYNFSCGGAANLSITGTRGVFFNACLNEPNLDANTNGTKGEALKFVNIPMNFGFNYDFNFKLINVYAGVGSYVFSAKLYDSSNNLISTTNIIVNAAVTGTVVNALGTLSAPSNGLYTIVLGLPVTEYGADFLVDDISLVKKGCDSDNDGIPDYLDTDSDNDGCPDAIEGGDNVLPSQVNAYPATGIVAPQGSINTQANGTSNGTVAVIDADGVPVLVNTGGVANITLPQGQSIGTSTDGIPSAACITVCYETPTNLTSSVPVKHGITVLGRAGADNGNWPMLRNSAYTALEGKTKGFVVTRNSSPETTITNPVVGMMVFDTNEGATGCLKIYTGSAVGEGWKCFSTQTCP